MTNYRTLAAGAVLLLANSLSAHAIPLWPVEVGSQWFYQTTDSSGGTAIESFNFTALVERDSVQYVVADDGFAINSTENSLSGYENIFTDPPGDMFSFIVDSTTPTTSVTTGLGTYDAFLYQSIESDYWVDNYIVRGFGLFYIEEGPIINGELVIEEMVELIGIQAVPVPPALLLFGTAIGYLFFRLQRKTDSL